MFFLRLIIGFTLFVASLAFSLAWFRKECLGCIIKQSRPFNTNWILWDVLVSVHWSSEHKDTCIRTLTQRWLVLQDLYPKFSLLVSCNTDSNKASTKCFTLILADIHLYDVSKECATLMVMITLWLEIAVNEARMFCTKFGRWDKVHHFTKFRIG